MAAAAYVDDARVGLADVFDLEVEAPAGRGQEVDQEHIRVTQQLHQRGVSCGVLEGQADAALPAVGVVHQRLE